MENFIFWAIQHETHILCQYSLIIFLLQTLTYGFWGLNKAKNHAIP